MTLRLTVSRPGASSMVVYIRMVAVLTLLHKAFSLDVKR